MGDAINRSLAGIALLAELPADRLSALEHACRWRRYAPKELIFDHHSTGTDLYFIVEGEVQIVNYSPSGREISFAYAPAGSYMGELSALDGRTRSATVVAHDETTVASLSAGTFKNLLLDHPKVALVVLMHLAEMVRTADERIMDLSTLSAINRVHIELLRMAEATDGDGNVGLIKPIPTHSEIASRASTTRETVSRALSHLARGRIIERTRDALVVLDLERLADLTEPTAG